MSIMKLLQQAQGGQGLGQLASQFGLDQGTADQLTQMLAPAIGSAAKKRVEQAGMENVLGAMRGEEQAQMFDDAAVAASTDGQAQGMAFLEQIMGGRQEAEGLAQEAASRAGVDAGTVSKFLPALAAMAQGGLQKQMPDSQIDGMIQEGGSSGGGLMGMIGGLIGGNKDGDQGSGLAMLSEMLDADGDGSPLDDILGKFMR
ncbi:MAG: DUF937 domain-containing protein [Roseovarius sp.]|jgi:hypothetical protein|uniref:DUF937 domain-containing protein n=1 Tax=Roseovarius sp. TaxID=1486281 RepID=UPI0032ED25BD